MDKVDPETFKDAFNLLCGDKLGEGLHRDVFECRINPKYVVKVESDQWRYFANVFEMKFWNDHEYFKPISSWLAPCDYLSPDGRILLQQRVRPCHDTDRMPNKVPSFLTDLKRANFGWIGSRLVCFDYAMVVNNPSTRLKKVDW